MLGEVVEDCQILGLVVMLLGMRSVVAGVERRVFVDILVAIGSEAA